MNATTTDAPASVRLRDATWRDIETLARLDAELFDHDAWSEPTWWAEFAERPRRQYVVAVAGNEDANETVLGYAGLDAGGSAVDVMTIAVTHAARGTGVGKRLLTHLVDAAAATDAEALLLEVRADNEPALGLYERSGFERLTLRRRYYQPGDVDAVIMRKLLETS